ncbi:hypothetical protein [uncultured Helicobacter sp.]|uniref:hypothetical protein n=1 Tax=uncultured Helicobacter sp. TaxID=175537 RepID=UPI00374EE810
MQLKIALVSILFVILAVFVFFYTKSPTTGLNDLISPIIEIKMAKFRQYNLPQNTQEDTQDSNLALPFEQTPQMRLLRLAKQYQKEHFGFLDQLENLAHTKEQKAFVEDYAKFLRLVLISSLAGFYGSEDNAMCYLLGHGKQLAKDFRGTPFGSDIEQFLQTVQAGFNNTTFARTETIDCRTKEQEFVGTLESFFADQSVFVESFGGEFFTFLENYTPLHVCNDATCGHPTELFALKNTLEKYKSTANEQKLQEIFEYALKGYMSYRMIMTATDGNLKDLEFMEILRRYADTLKQEEIQSILQEFEYGEDHGLEGLGNFWIFTYLNQLYGGSYVLALEAKLLENTQNTQEINQIIKTAMDQGFAICNYGKLSKEAQGVCMNLDSSFSSAWLPDKVTKDKRFFIAQKQNCFSLQYKQDGNRLFLHIENSKTNKSPLCKHAQHQIKEIAAQEVYDLRDIQAQDSKQSPILTQEQQNALNLIESPHFSEYLALYQKGESSSTQEYQKQKYQKLCESKNPLACAIIGRDKKDMGMLQDSCKQGVIEACDDLINAFLSKDSTLSPQEFLNISKVNCEFGSYEACSLVGKMLLHTKNFDFEGIAQDTKSGLKYLMLGCQKGGGLGCEDVLAHIDEVIALGLLSQNTESSSKETFKNYACNKLEFSIKECAGEEAKAIFETQALFMQKIQMARYENGTIIMPNTTDKQSEGFTQEDITFFENTCKNIGNIACDSLMRAYQYFYTDDKEVHNQKLAWAAEIGCRRDDARSCAILATFSDGVDSAHLRQKACDLMPWQMGYVSPFSRVYKNYKNCEIVGDLYQLGLDVAHNGDMAKVYYYKACINGENEACEKLLGIINSK